MPERTRLYLLAPVVRGRKGEYRKEIAEYMKRGFQRLKIDGQFYDIADAPALDKKFKHDIDVVVDRIVVRPDISARLAESFETALELADGLAVVEFAESAEGKAAGTHRLLVEILLPGLRLFDRRKSSRACFPSTTRIGACPKCGGIGSEQKVDPDLIVPNPEPDPAQGRHRALGQVALALLRARRWRRSARRSNSAWRTAGRTCPEARETSHPLWLGRQGNACSPMPTACAPMR